MLADAVDSGFALTCMNQLLLGFHGMAHFVIKHFHNSA
jgi:hypothetical protein